MIKSTPNSNLLTVADSPFQHHLVSLIIYLYIYKQIQMLLDASTTKEESLAYNPQGGRIVLHTACDKEVATFAFGQEAQWRNGKYNRPHLYVEGNPVSYRDPSGNNAIIGQLNAIMKHMMGSIKIGDKIGRSIGRGLDYSMRKAGRGIDGAARQLASGGKYSRNKGNDLDHILGTRRTFAGIENSNLGDWITKQYNQMRTKPIFRTQEQRNKKSDNQFKQDIYGCFAAFHDNMELYTICASAARNREQSRQSEINTEPGDNNGDSVSEPTPVEIIIIACSFSNPGPHETSQFCQDDPNNPANKPPKPK